MMTTQKFHTTGKAFILESGQQIANLTLGYHTFGQLNEKKNNIIWAFHALTGSSDVLDWWKGLFGVHCLFDPKDYYIICVNVLGSPYGSTQPASLDFPLFSLRDIVKSQLLLADHLCINQISIAIGGSFGGNQALEFAYAYPGSIDKLILIASSAKESAWSIAVHETQRMAMKSDKTFGQEGGGTEGMAAARAIGMLTYRTSETFIQDQTDKEEKVDDFKASSYIQYQGEKFIKRFNALSYYYLTKCMDTHNIGRGRGGIQAALKKISTPTLVIGITSDLLIPVSMQINMAEHLPNSTYEEIDSEYGHDGFLVETSKITNLIKKFITSDKGKRIVMKFGGSSLANGKAISKSLDIISKAAKSNPIALIVSARGKTTDKLVSLYETAINSGGDNSDWTNELDTLILEQGASTQIDFTSQKVALHQLLKAVSIIGCPIPSARNQIVAYGELMSAELITESLKLEGHKALMVDARKLIVTQSGSGKEHEVDMAITKERIKSWYELLSEDVLPVITGFIASNQDGETTNLGRNGSNYTATLFAKFLKASEVQNWTDVNGVYSAHPKYVKSAVQIPHLTYHEANELANFGASVLHSKTILPLMDSNIPIKIFNSFSNNPQGTLIDNTRVGRGVKAVSLIEDIALIKIAGTGMAGKVGIDSRIFSRLSQNNINVRLIAQASAERGIGFVVDALNAKMAQEVLHEEFKSDFQMGHISEISINLDIVLIAITGRHNYALEKAIEGLRKEKIWIHLFSNSISGQNISLVIDASQAYKALNLVHEKVVVQHKDLKLPKQSALLSP